MNHLTDEQLVEHYFGEGANRVATETHLRVCARCEQAYDEISNVLRVRGPEPPARQAGYGKRVWQSIQAQLRPYPGKPRPRYFTMPRLVLAGTCLAGLTAAFVGGTLWERSRTHSQLAGNPSQVKERMALYILDDHLDRSERLLVQLNHAGTDTGDGDAVLQAEARQLLPDNRLYRQALSGGSDPIMNAALEHLERVLLEMANSPNGLNGDDITRIEQEMNTDSLLFQIRVLRARSPRPEPKLELTQKGASI